jgi:hypothetical protein
MYIRHVYIRNWKRCKLIAFSEINPDQCGVGAEVNNNADNVFAVAVDSYCLEMNNSTTQVKHS